MCNNLALLDCQEHEHGLAKFSYGQTWAMGCSTQFSLPLPSLSLGHLPHQCQGLWQARQSTGKGHGAGVSGHCLPFAAEPHSAWPALNHRGILAGITRPSSLSPSKLPLALLSLCRCIKTLRSAWEKLLLLHYPAVSIHRTCKNQVPHQKIIKAIL